MNIVFFARKRASSGLVVLSRTRIAALALGVMGVLPASFLYLGYQMGANQTHFEPSDLEIAMQTELDQQRLVVTEATRSAEENMNALALRLGNLQAHVIRLDALGQRLTKIAKLDKGEFDFDSEPAQGGPVSNAGVTMDVPDFVKSLTDLSAQLEDRSEQLAVLETMLMNRNLQAEVMPAGRPVNPEQASIVLLLTQMRMPSCLLALSNRAAVLMASPWAV